MLARVSRVFVHKNAPILLAEQGQALWGLCVQGPPQLVCDESRGHQDTDEQHRADAVLVVAVSPDYAAEGEGAVVRSTRLWQARFLGFTY